ncbi:hypothetical protein ANCDUO_00550 [Ancylostoma duodenale]|uniref:Uncharacterized protein n=1 Tax=Ancylostoma duodenale TaxID=51022 RepID=A0A0C2DGK3_9BILA|nr:hypothetical protein ANCDUO_00550 [Ancylostoma duodenale]
MVFSSYCSRLFVYTSNSKICSISLVFLNKYFLSSGVLKSSDGEQKRRKGVSLTCTPLDVQLSLEFSNFYSCASISVQQLYGFDQVIIDIKGFQSLPNSRQFNGVKRLFEINENSVCRDVELM